MTPIHYTARSSIIGSIWGGVFFGLLRSFMLGRWHFDFLRADHWRYLGNLWLEGWKIDTFYEWSFVILWLAILPVFLTGWAMLYDVEWEKMFENFKTKIKNILVKEVVVVKEVGSAEVIREKNLHEAKHSRPQALREMPSKEKDEGSPTKVMMPQKTGAGENLVPKNSIPSSVSTEDKSALIPSHIKETISKPEEEPKAMPQEEKKTISPTPLSHPKEDVKKTILPKLGPPPSIIFDRILARAGYTVLENVSLDGKKIDFMGVAKDKIVLLKVDHSEGEWLADEEKFNGEDPLWFSESDHRTSPVYHVLGARDALQKRLKKDLKKDLPVQAFLCMTQGRIINADDMKDVWEKKDVSVTRFAAGGPHLLRDITDVITINSEKPADPDLIKKLKEKLSS